MSTRREAVKAAFLALKQELADDVVNVALDICARHNLSTEELITKWEAYIMNNKLEDELPSRESLRVFAEQLNDKELVKVTTNHKPPKTYTKETLPKYVIPPYIHDTNSRHQTGT